MTTFQYVDCGGHLVGKCFSKPPLVVPPNLRLSIHANFFLTRTEPDNSIVLTTSQTRTEIEWSRLEFTRWRVIITLTGNREGIAIDTLMEEFDSACQQLCGVQIVDLRPKLLGLPDLSGPWDRLKWWVNWIRHGNVAEEVAPTAPVCAEAPDPAKDHEEAFMKGFIAKLEEDAYLPD